jgi:hypothetical protein
MTLKHMHRRFQMLLRVGIGLIALGVVAGIAAAIFWDGPDRDRTVEYRVVEQDGEQTAGEDPGVVVVADQDWDGPRFFPAISLLVIGGVLVTIALVRGRGGWGDPGSRFEEWHRTAHSDNPASPTGA